MTEDIRSDLRHVVARLAELTKRRDELIREAMAAKIRPGDLVADTGLTRARLYQIRDGR